jgi:hypothetical protein
MDFDQWWPCLKKHTKRVHHLLPHAKALSAELTNRRPFRYFTLCAPPMIDVFMLAKENVLQYDETRLAIDTVVFCEMDPERVPMMRELVGRENSGFEGKLEDLVLFEDVPATAPFPDLRSIEAYRIRKGESLPEVESQALTLKVANLELQKCFPFDFLNLDFCEHYYPSTPDILEINRTVKKMLSWQRRSGRGEADDSTVTVDSFLTAITCRLDDGLPKPAKDRLINLVDSNCNDFPEYAQEVRKTRGPTTDEWAEKAKLDFFLSGWPKEIAHLAEESQWNMEILEYVHYSRISTEKKVAYEMICLMCKFTRSSVKNMNLRISMQALSPEHRVLIDSIDRAKEPGTTLLDDLTEIVLLRNKRGENASQELLQLPNDAILFYEKRGVQY